MPCFRSWNSPHCFFRNDPNHYIGTNTSTSGDSEGFHAEEKQIRARSASSASSTVDGGEAEAAIRLASAEREEKRRRLSDVKLAKKKVQLHLDTLKNRKKEREDEV